MSVTPRASAAAIWIVAVAGAFVVGGATLLASAPGDRETVVPGIAIAIGGYALGIAGVRRSVRDEPAVPLLWTTILIVAVASRAVLVLADPVLEDDVHRYLWDGAVAWAGESPYAFSPQEVMDARLGRDLSAWSDGERARLEALAALSREPALEVHYLAINYPSVPTIYPPAAQGVFAAITAVAPGSLPLMKLVVIAADLLTAAGVWLLLVRLGKPRWWFVVYAWSPLLIVVFAGAAHMDSLAMAPMVWAFVMLERRAPIAAGVLLGLAIAFKLFAVVAVPILLVRLGVRGAVAVAVTVAAAFLSFAGEPRLFEGLTTFAEKWRYNEAGFGIVAAAIGDRAARVAIGAAIMTLVGVLAWRARREPLAIGAVTWAFTALVVMAPAVNPWYVAWLLPFAVISGARAIALLTVTILGYYTIAFFEGDLGVRIAEYAPPLAIAITLARRR